MPKIIYLNGPSSSGKTTLADALQESLDEPFLCLSLDRVIQLMPKKLNNWEGGSTPLGFCWRPDVDSSGQPIHHIHAGPFAKKIVRTMKDFALLLASQDYNLIIDDVAFGAAQVEEWKQVLKNYPVLYVGVQAPLEVLEKREKDRGNRILGSARGQHDKVHQDVVYDLKINTHSQSIGKNVQKIKTTLSRLKQFGLGNR